MILGYDGAFPEVGNRVFIAENATVIGNVRIGDDVSIWFGSVIRGDVDSISIGARTNIQDLCVVHVTGGAFPTTIDEDVTIGHGVIAHGCRIGRGSLIGMGARILDGAVVGEECLIGAGALVTEGMQIPARKLVLGFPAKVRRDLTSDELEKLRRSPLNYVGYKEIYLRDAEQDQNG